MGSTGFVKPDSFGGKYMSSLGRLGGVSSELNFFYDLDIVKADVISLFFSINE